MTRVSAIRGVPVLFCLCALGCAYDWTLPPPAGADGGDPSGTSGGGTRDETGQAGAMGGAGGELAAGGSGGMLATPCAASADCAACVACVYADTGGTATGCVAFTTCVVACGGNANCKAGCAAQFAAGSTTRLALDAQCSALCGGPPACL